MKRGHDLLQRTFSFSDAHAVAHDIFSLLTVRSCRLQAYKNDVYFMPKELVEKVATLQPHSSLSVSTQVKLFITEVIDVECGSTSLAEPAFVECCPGQQRIRFFLKTLSPSVTPNTAPVSTTPYCEHGKRRWRFPECDHFVKRRKR